MNYLKFTGLFILSVIILSACQNKTTNLTQKKSPISTDTTISFQQISSKKALPAAIGSPTDSMVKGHLLLPFAYRVWENNNVSKVINDNWLELYRKNGKYYVGKAKYKITYEKEEPCSGLPTETIDSENDVLVFFNIANIQHGAVDSISFPNKIIPSNESFEFTYKNDRYQLRASGIEFYKDEDRKPNAKYTLKLFINGQYTRTLIDQSAYHDTATELEFIGDLDRDGKLDFVISSPRDYEESRTIVILSTAAYPFVGTVQFDC
jgi:hypothetical protein